MEIVALMPFLIPIVAILAHTYAKTAKIKAEAARDLGKATGHLEDALADARADRDRLRRRVEALEAIVTSEGWDLEREAHRAGLTSGPTVAGGRDAGRLDPGLLDAEPAPAPSARRPRTRE